MLTALDEPIVVGAVFGGGKKLRPVWFVRNGREHRIQTENAVWTTREGRAAIYHFSVSDGSGLYEICYNTEAMTWRLRGVEAEG
jgi:hypothetical protein